MNAPFVNRDVRDVAALEDCIGKTPGPMALKVIDHLDAGALRWLAASPLMFAGFAAPGQLHVTLAGGEPGFTQPVGEKRFRIPAARIDDPGLARKGQGFGGLFLIPTIGETLRVNGQVVAVDGAAIEIEVAECYVHCAKALIRSDFWTASPLGEVPADPQGFLQVCRFIALASADSEGHADVSPKGDPAGMLIRLSDDGAWFADRPGNRRADSFRNMLTQPRVAVAALVPGSTRIALLSGAARITRDEHVRAGFAVKDRTPVLATCIETPEMRLATSATLERARLWPAAAPAEPIDPAAIIVGHVRASKERGLQASLSRAAVSVPGMMKKGLEHDYKTRLY